MGVGVLDGVNREAESGSGVVTDSQEAGVR